MDGLLICGGDSQEAGGGGSRTTCITFSSGVWVTSHTLAEKRVWHTSWATDEGIILMGGSDSDTTSEIIKQGEQNGVSAFNLVHRTQ